MTRLVFAAVLAGAISTPMLGAAASTPADRASTTAAAPLAADRATASTAAAADRAAASTAAAAAPADCRAFPSEADGPHRADEARAAFGVDGTGVTVGIISDSFGLVSDPTTPADDVALGVLPGPGNPCGYETPVEVLVEGPDGSADEGRAMAQLIHGIAPGARLIFASFATQPVPPGMPEPRAVFAAAQALAEAGADIIVDDIGEFDLDLYYQRGVTSVQMDELTAADAGLMFLSSAGNDNLVGPDGTEVAGRPVGSWQTAAYRPAGCPEWMADGTPDDLDCLDFSGTGDTSYGVELRTPAAAEHSMLQWGEAARVFEPVPSAFELRIYDAATHTRVATSTANQPNFPITWVLPADPPAADLPPGDYDIVVARTRDGGDLPAMWMMPFDRSGRVDLVPEYAVSTGADAVGPTVSGHPAHGSAIGVAAAEWTTPDVPEPFSSIGPGIELFGPFDEQPAPPLPEPVITAAPQITGVDGTLTSFFGRPADGGYRFSGTSAAAPNVAAVLALAKSLAPEATRDELTRLLAETALPMTNPYAAFGYADEHVIGAGLADAYALLAALAPPTPTPGPTPGPSPTAAPAALPETGADAAAALAPAAALLAGALVALLAVAARRRSRRPAASTRR
ncbi:S8 family serine peptidase [Agromyces archimandritae]|uniref:S8 family serine peptidase n=1 Tax=Agromyces archimandritae TaxID=2781962 RepID=A0A975FKD2_9MICO|nr:S8 family serine peptidase [Agromyces archimandritae]QTX03461.1 S8 family serine peptidase [Agromyces archimandritae]